MATQTKLITYDDYRTLPDDGKRYEIIRGKLIMAPAPILYHQIISGNLYKVLDSYVQKKSLGQVLYAPVDIVLSMTDVVQPDLMFISDERSHIITEKNIVEAPDLIVEIASEGTKIRDRTTKKDLYKKYGVKEYWIVYPDEREAEQFVLQDEAFELNDELTSSGKLASKVIDGLIISTDQIFSD